MKQRRWWQGILIAMMGVALTLAPLSAASAHRAKHHSGASTKGSNPGSAMCQKVKTEQTGSSSVGLAIEKAMTSGNFAAAKQAMLNAYNTDAGNVQKALAVIKTAPSNVQTAFKGLLTFVQQIKTDIQNASSLQGLISSFQSLGTNQKLVADGTTISNWYTSVCGGTLVPATSTSLP